MHTLVKLVALSVEKYYMALTEIQLRICRFHGSLSRKVPDPWYNVLQALSRLSAFRQVSVSAIATRQ